MWFATTIKILILLFWVVMFFYLCWKASCLCYFAVTHPRHAAQKIFTATSRLVGRIIQYLRQLQFRPRNSRNWTAYLALIVVLYVGQVRLIAYIAFWSQIYGTRATTEIYYVAEESSVSGFYGPGAYSAWLVTAITAGINHLRPQASLLPVCRPPKRRLGGDVLASIAYPGIAFVDVSIQLILASKHRGNYSQAQAGIFVLESTTKVAMVIISHQQPRPFRKIHRVTCFLFYMLFFPIGVASNEGEPQYLDGLWTKQKTFEFLVILPMVGILIHADWRCDASGWRSTQLLATFSIFQIALSFYYPPYTLFPSSSSRFTDLDQLAALGPTLLVLLYSWYEGIRSMAVDLRTRMSEMWTASLRILLAWRRGVPVLFRSLGLDYRRRARIMSNSDEQVLENGLDS